jgi:hypothetical protein
MYRGEEAQFHHSWRQHLIDLSGRLHAIGTHWIGHWVDPRASPDTVEKRKSCPAWNWTWTIQLVFDCNTNWAIPTHSPLQLLDGSGQLNVVTVYSHAKQESEHRARKNMLAKERALCMVEINSPFFHTQSFTWLLLCHAMPWDGVKGHN